MGRWPNTLGLALTLGCVVLAICGPRLIPYDPLAIAYRERLQAPSTRHLLGTDYYGRDVLARVAAGARLSLYGGLVVTLGAMIIGLSIALAATSLGSLADAVLMNVSNLTLTIPPFLLGMMIVTILGASLHNVVLAIMVTRWPDYARLIRAQVLVVRARPYVEAARSTGAGEVYVLLRHILPSMLASVVIKMSMDIGTVILLMASLSFVGLGVTPPTPEWGSMVAEARMYAVSHPWTALAPGMAVFATVLGFSLLGDGLRDALDPHSM